ncbi:FkbM family methyltransferase [Candidatus Zixiibacteriota bacterium]
MMKQIPAKTIYQKLTRKGFKPQHVAEIGVYFPETSNVYDYIRAGIKCTLVEPNPESVEKIKQHFAGQDNVTLHPVAIYDRKGQVELVRRAASTFVGELATSPAIVNDDYRLDDGDKFTVKACTFDEIDDGTIDLLCVDVEGSEWFVIKHMISRPAVISLETHGSAYVNPYLDEILNWMSINDYLIWYKDQSDTVFVKDEVITITWPDVFHLIRMNGFIFWKRIKRKLKKRRGM